MEAYIKFEAKKTEYSVEKKKEQANLGKEIRLDGNISSDIVFYLNGSYQKIKYAKFCFRIKDETDMHNDSYLYYPPTLLGDKNFEIFDSKTIAGFINFSEDEFNHIYDLLIVQNKKYILTLAYDFPSNCDLLIVPNSPLGKFFPNLEVQTYILSHEGLFYLSDIREEVSKHHLIDLSNSQVALEVLWEHFACDYDLTTEGELLDLSKEDELLIQKTGHSRKIRSIEGFVVKHNYILESHLEKKVPGPMSLRVVIK